MPRAEIATTQAKHTLLQLHAELAGKILDNQKEADRLRAAMQHVEAVVKLLDPTHNLRTIAVRRRKLNPWFKRGTVFRSALDVLRRAGEPLTVAEITARMLEAKRIKDAPRSEVAKLEGTVRAALQIQDGGAISANRGTNPTCWSLR